MVIAQTNITALSIIAALHKYTFQYSYLLDYKGLPKYFFGIQWFCSVTKLLLRGVELQTIAQPSQSRSPTDRFQTRLNGTWAKLEWLPD